MLCPLGLVGDQPSAHAAPAMHRRELRSNLTGVRYRGTNDKKHRSGTPWAPGFLPLPPEAEQTRMRSNLWEFAGRILADGRARNRSYAHREEEKPFEAKASLSHWQKYMLRSCLTPFPEM
jgi:hypothetical protein